jgi:hypothetical protein
MCACSDCAGCEDPENMACDSMTFSVRQTFVEAFRATELGLIIDSHGTSPDSIRDYIARRCARPCDPCCEWCFEKHTTKTVAIGPNVAVPGSGLRSPIRFEEQVLNCRECGASATEDEYGGLNYPEGHSLVPTLGFPAGGMTKTKRYTLRVSHERCAEFAVGSLSMGEFK